MLAARNTRRSILGTVSQAAPRPQWRLPVFVCPQCRSKAASTKAAGTKGTSTKTTAPRTTSTKTKTADTKTTAAKATKSNQLSKQKLQTTSPLAEQLGATGIWHYGRWARKTEGTDAAETNAKTASTSPRTKKVKGDKHRVNIVSEPLCKDIVKYMSKSLRPRHTGCDIIDIYPGAGLWSKALHKALKPRSHILLEPDAALYTPFLQPLLDKPNVTLVPKSGIIWRELSNVLTPEYLPHQTPVANLADPPQRNDTLLVTANLAFFPKRRFSMFESLTQLVLYQFINSIRASSLFHKYGLVRMLVWVESSDRHALLARSVQRRRRLAVDGELATEWITEVAGPQDASSWFVRDTKLDVASSRGALARMRAAGVKMPATREPDHVAALRRGRSGPKPKITPRDPADLDAPPVFPRPFHGEQKDLEARFAAGDFAPKSAEHRRMLQLQYRGNREAKVAEAVHALLQRRDALADEHDVHATRTHNIRRRENQWNAEIDALAGSDRQDFALYRDNLHVFRQDPPVLSWDRRTLEPLLVRDDEFFPNTPCSLLDIQPKAMHPLLRTVSKGAAAAAAVTESAATESSTTPTSTPPSTPTHDLGHSGDIFELILRGMLSVGAEPVRKAIEFVWPGAADGVLPHCPSLVDRRRGGVPVGGPYGELSARSLNETQWVEILDAWMRWPFRPTLPQLVARISEDAAEVDDDEGMD
ncbi:hypothetical protein SPBR_05696 [Sporothrix brasiliensis 5110]|uniref:rRNA adenine N(6)-methyltransferase n=1 Tax=Sporothrix brasiliensis 5110 TaxID=1398154 RepID=A0A0C2JAA6_9PEZI|nr:uncharacterized protein SPBR_05696 [Sporothrix brasiliensis 5110]KIH93847.1 hypothetical protein SPBR_05696 [Sporothrix brasiliensis 5110]